MAKALLSKQRLLFLAPKGAETPVDVPANIITEVPEWVLKTPLGKLVVSTKVAAVIETSIQVPGVEE